MHLWSKYSNRTISFTVVCNNCSVSMASWYTHAYLVKISGSWLDNSLFTVTDVLPLSLFVHVISFRFIGRLQSVVGCSNSECLGHRYLTILYSVIAYSVHCPDFLSYLWTVQVQGNIRKSVWDDIKQDGIESDWNVTLTVPELYHMYNMYWWHYSGSAIAAATASFWTYAIFMKRTNGAVRVGTLIPMGNNCISFFCGMIMFSCVFSVLLRLGYGTNRILDIIGDNGPANTGLTFIW